jgi:STE24 endopeptidase
LFWLVAAMAALLFAMAGPGQMIIDAMGSAQSRAWLGDSAQTALLLGAAICLFAVVFGFVSRKFERQADVFAARTIQNAFDASGEQPETALSLLESTPLITGNTIVLDEPGVILASPPGNHVGTRGASVYCSALERIAAVNNIPIAARSWCHGSLEKRMRYLEYLSRDPERTARFDRFMLRFYVVLLLGLCAFAVWTMIVTMA